MADADIVTLGKINYWCREGHYRHMQNAALDGLKKYGNDPLLKYFYGYSLILEDRVQEGLRELEPLKDKRDVNLCTLMAMLLGHKKSKVVDKEAVQQLDSKLKEERKQAGEKGLYFAGLFLVQTGRCDKAREYVDRVIKLNQQSKEGLALKGWLEMLSGKEENIKKAMKYFDESLSQSGTKDIEALFGKAKYCEMRRNFGASLELINQAIVTFPNFTPALIEKMKVQLALQDWEQTVETAQRVLAQEPHCLLAERYLVLNLLCREGNYDEAAQKIEILLQLMDRSEPKAHALYDEFAKVFCRLSGRNALVLQQTYHMQERAVSIDSTNAGYVTELGYELYLQGKFKDAVKCYRNAIKLDEASVAALMGIIRCQLNDNQLEDASQQLEFLNEIQKGTEKSVDLCYLSAVLAMKREKPLEEIIQLLNAATEAHFATLRGFPMGTDYLMQMNPDFLIQIVSDHLVFAPEQPGVRGQAVSPLLKRCSQVLEPLTKAVPGLMHALYLMGKVRYLSGEIDAARSTLQHCLEQDPTYSDVHILMAQIHLYQNNFKLASQSLEVGLSHNFEVREHPLYHLIRARIHKKQGELQEALKTLQTAMTLPGVKVASVPISKKSKSFKISNNDRVSVFLELAEVHTLLGEQHEAAKVMQDAVMEFRGTPEETRVSIANADLSLSRGDIEGALSMLRAITPEHPYFVQAREKMASIYLNHRKDKRLYASCYRELVEKSPTPHNCVLLGDAYMSIQEPDRAIEVYETALKKNPRDAMLASKIGQAYVKTHNYGKAVNYYEAALKQGGQQFLRNDLAELLVKLRQYEKAEKILNQTLEAEASATDLETLIEHSKYYVLLSKVYMRQEKVEESFQHLTKAHETQTRVLKRVQLEQPDILSTQRQLAASICCQLAQYVAQQQKDYERSIKYLKDALQYMEGDGRIMLELAKFYLTIEDLDSCQFQCMTLLKNDTENDEANVMMADLMFRKNDYEQATHHFTQLLQRRPDHYVALARLVDLMRRAGKIEELPKFFQLAETQSGGRAPMDAGYNFCQGLYEWYIGNVNSALKHFNKARKDSDWGTKATYNMIEICLNPDNETMGGEVFESVEQDLGGRQKVDSEQMALRTAEKLLKDMKAKPGDMRAKILENMWLISTKNKQNIEKALNTLSTFVTAEQDNNVGALNAIAVGCMILKQTPRARNQLKRIAKSSWNIEDGDDLEKGWLLLADIYIQGGKYDMATEMLKRCLQYNKSCCKAYEYMGFIMEKEQSYKDAAHNYEMAWKYGNKSNPNIGFKLAFNYVKARRFVDAVDICYHVLNTHPDYPKIRKEILDKAWSSIRV